MKKRFGLTAVDQRCSITWRIQQKKGASSIFEYIRTVNNDTLNYRKYVDEEHWSKASTSTDFQNFKNYIYLIGHKVTYQ